MKTVCLLFEIHQPFRLKKYRFYDIGADHYYYDDYANEEILKRLAYQSYIPAAKMLLEMIQTSEKKFKVALCISGVAMEQFEMYCPEFLDCVRELVATGCCELCCETYSHSLSSLVDPEDFKYQVELQKKIINDTFQYDSKTFVNTGFIYNDEIGAEIAAMGFKGVVTEGTRHVLGWKSPNYVYSTAAKQDVGLMFRNTKLSEDICLNFQYGLDAGQYMGWIADSPAEEKVYLIAMNFDVIGGMNPESSGIFNFFKALPYFAEQKDIRFATPAECWENIPPIAVANVGHPISWDGYDKDVSAWMGNDLQNEAIRAIYSISERLHMSNNEILRQDFAYLLSADHFKFMSTKMGSYVPFSPYDSSFDAFTNYLNIVSDMEIRLKQEFPEEVENEELNPLLKQINEQGKVIEKLQAQLEKAEKKLNEKKAAAKKPAAKKPAAKKPATKKEEK
ncbi:MAG: glycoside hydrolase family 57 protein [Bacteroidales bacterium]|nr:glycoside hydrolase family 57 protein [Bacteroidales bacterium]